MNNIHGGTEWPIDARPMDTDSGVLGAGVRLEGADGGRGGHVQ